MSGYNAELKRATEYAKKVMAVKKKDFLEECGGTIFFDGNTYFPGIRHWYHLKGYRAKSTSEETAVSLKRACEGFLRASCASGADNVFMLRKTGGEISVLYGTGGNGIGEMFSAQIPECVMEEGLVTEREYLYSGVMTGTIVTDDLCDCIARANDISSCFVAFAAIPVADGEIEEKIRQNRSNMTYLGEHKSFQRVYGNATRRVEEMPINEVVNAISLLKEETEYLAQNRGNGFVQTCMRMGAATKAEYDKLVRLIQSCMCFPSENRGGYEAVRKYDAAGFAPLPGEFYIPAVSVTTEEGTFCSHAVTLVDIPTAASVCMPPKQTHKGFLVKNYHIDEDEETVFSGEAYRGEGIDIGVNLQFDCQAVLPVKNLVRHSVSFGTTGSGKTTGVKKILTELYEKHNVGFVVMEAAKKEYASLLGNIRNLKVYTPGHDGEMLRINPLQPEDGTLIENHVAAIVRALTASTGGEHPLPEAFDGLLKQTYKSFGWEYGMMAYTDPNKPFPTFKAVLDMVDGYIAAHAQYGPEVKRNITAALTLRSEMMHSGALGRVFSHSAALSAKDFFEAPTVIELSDFSEQAVTFLMNVLLFKFQCYLSNQPESDRLKRLIVLEEAHNIIKRTLSEESGRAKNNEAFEKMLAELRSSGTGLMISDQRPSVIPGAVLANTDVKIVYSLAENEDREAVASAMDMTDFQKRKLRELKVGECVISMRDNYGLQHVKITPLEKREISSAACLVCKMKFRCRVNEVRRLLESADREKIMFHIAKIKSNVYNPQHVVRSIDSMLKDLNIVASDTTKICLLGEILNMGEDVSFQNKRIIIATYSNDIRR